jgi:beta-glucosidase-like glycosyl hydrolase
MARTGRPACAKRSLACRAALAQRSERLALCEHAHAQALAAEAARCDCLGWQREVHALAEAHAEALQQARAAAERERSVLTQAHVRDLHDARRGLNAELAAVRREAAEAERRTAHAAVLLRQAERDVRNLPPPVVASYLWRLQFVIGSKNLHVCILLHLSKDSFACC